MGHEITGVVKNSIADRLNVPTGGILKSINGRAVTDVFDYRLLIQEEYLDILIDDTCYRIKKGEYEDIGLLFKTSLMDKQRSCNNKCIFCFIDQLPEGMRETLYYKDDDPRLSFLHGNYVTLTNIDDKELDRLIDLRLSPVNISAHTTDPRIRQTMLNNKNAGRLLEQIERLAAADILMNFQIVLCKGVNDGGELFKTIETLSHYIPQAQSLSVVPAGLTKYRRGLNHLSSYTPLECADIIKRVEDYQNRFLDIHETRFVYAADEFYVKAGLPFPAYRTYEDFCQIENGVGMAAMTLYRLKKGLRKVKRHYAGKSVSVATGVCAYPLMLRCRELIKRGFPGIDMRVHRIKNRFFGSSITVSGLLTGRDITDGLINKDLGDILILPMNVLRDNERTLLDNTTADNIKRALGRPVYFCHDDNFLDTVLKGGA